MNKKDIIKIIEDVTLHLSTLRDPENKYAVRVPDGRLIPNRDFTFWEWTSGVGLYGIMKTYESTKNNKFLDIIYNWFEEQLPKETEKNINTMVQMLTLCDLYKIKKDSRYLDVIKEWGEWLVNKLPRTKEGGFQHVVYASIHEQQLWVDTLMMSALTIGRIGVLLDNKNYIDEAKYQFLIHSKYLFDTKNDLWFHGYSFIEKSNFSEAHWGRGNSWPTIAIPQIINICNLSSNDPVRKFLENILINHIDKLSKLQDKSGLWHTILDDNSSYLETSCTAGFAYGLQYAINSKLIDKKYQTNVNLAVQGLLKNITKEGGLLNVSGGTPVFKTSEEYKKVILGDYPYGQSMAILALIEYIKVI
ncbi:glycoside hydrolase family 88 protein [Spiroplasma endosymbiont of Aspidapion aeneum]|uniref:glycoside hydrolase family 88/105 protein n=1 Tax=Spiroplasma endosymbiont of Aspidapion aeneum TaxID=3066276 RepID=UPI00313C8F7B